MPTHASEPAGGTTGRQSQARILVGAQLALLATMAVTRRAEDWPTPAPLRAAAAAAQAAGIGFAAWSAATLGPALTASPLPNRRAALRQDGPFGVVRHPIYSGLLLAAGARTAASGSRRQLLALALLAGLRTTRRASRNRPSPTGSRPIPTTRSAHPA